jgi:hypothetical protein
MAVPQRPNLRASGTGILAYAALPSCKTTNSRILEDQFAISELSSWLSDVLQQHSQEWLCHKDLKEKGYKPNPPLRFERAGGA